MVTSQKKIETNTDMTSSKKEIQTSRDMVSSQKEIQTSRDMLSSQKKIQTSRDTDNFKKKNAESIIMLKKIVYNVLTKRNIVVTPDIIDKYFLRYNITKKSSKEVFNQMINDIRNETNTRSNTVIYEEKYIELTELIYIDSNDRDIKKWKNPNNFFIYLNKFNKFTTVTSIRLVSAIFPKKINNKESIDNYPYIILEIKELGSSYTSINKSVNKAFALLTFDIDLGEYNKLLSKSSLEYNKLFNPPISLIELNIKLKTPDGKLLNYVPIKKNIKNNDQSTKIKYNPNVDSDLDNGNLDSDDLEDKYKSINFIFEVNYKKSNNNIDLLHQ